MCFYGRVLKIHEIYKSNICPKTVMLCLGARVEMEEVVPAFCFTFPYQHYWNNKLIRKSRVCVNTKTIILAGKCVNFWEVLLPSKTIALRRRETCYKTTGGGETRPRIFYKGKKTRHQKLFNRNQQETR